MHFLLVYILRYLVVSFFSGFFASIFASMVEPRLHVVKKRFSSEEINSADIVIFI